jgi:hypothetical protein
MVPHRPPNVVLVGRAVRRSDYAVHEESAIRNLLYRSGDADLVLCEVFNSLDVVCGSYSCRFQLKVPDTLEDPKALAVNNFLVRANSYHQQRLRRQTMPPQSRNPLKTVFRQTKSFVEQ